MKVEKKYALLAGGVLALFLVVIASVVFLSASRTPESKPLPTATQISDAGVPSAHTNVSSASVERDPLEKTAVQPPDESSRFWFVALVLMLIVSLGMNGMMFYRVKRQLRPAPSESSGSSTDSDLIRNIAPTLNKLSTLPELMVKVSQRSDERFGQLEQKIANVTEMVGIFKDSVDKKDKEIERFKKGYDYVVFKRFVGRYLRLHKELSSMVIDAPENQDLKDALILLEDAIYECGVQKYLPVLGSNYAETEGLENDPPTVPVSEGSEPYQIVEVLEPGFRLELPDGYDYLRKSKVAISAPV